MQVSMCGKQSDEEACQTAQSSAFSADIETLQESCWWCLLISSMIASRVHTSICPEDGWLACNSGFLKA